MHLNMLADHASEGLGCEMFQCAMKATYQPSPGVHIDSPFRALLSPRFLGPAASGPCSQSLTLSVMRSSIFLPAMNRGFYAFRPLRTSRGTRLKQSRQMFGRFSLLSPRTVPGACERGGAKMIDVDSLEDLEGKVITIIQARRLIILS